MSRPPSVFRRVLMASMLTVGSSALGLALETPPPATMVSEKNTETNQAIEQLMIAGTTALRRYRQDQSENNHSLIEAALSFSQAIDLAHTQAHNDNLAEAQSSLFWCKKEMNLPQMQAFLRQLHDDPTPSDLPAASAPSTPAVVSTPPPTTIFDQLGSSPDQRREPPGAGRISRMREQIRTTYRDDYQRTSPAAKIKLARRLIEEARQHSADADLAYAQLQEGLRLAIETRDLTAILTAAIGIGSGYTGPTSKDIAAQHLPHIEARQLRPALHKLCEQPADPLANWEVGRYLCTSVNAWDVGLPLITRGTDRRWAELASADLEHPTTPERIRLLAESWYTIAQNAGDANLRSGALERAAWWYRRLPANASQTVRLAELDQLIPLHIEDLDWENISPGIWERLPGVVVFAKAEQDKIGPLKTLAAGERIRIVPHPQDTWTFADGRSCTARGMPSTSSGTNATFPGGCLLVQLGNIPPIYFTEIAGPGAVFLLPNRPSGALHGVIRVKLLTLDQPPL